MMKAWPSHVGNDDEKRKQITAISISNTNGLSEANTNSCSNIEAVDINAANLVTNSYNLQTNRDTW
jgi:hypothetical protein